MTPGPWEVVKASVLNSRYAIRQVGSDDEMYVDIADVWNSEEALADATLMAAAPELLAACKLAFDALYGLPLAELSATEEMLQEVIKKAEPGNKDG